jgi:hypothetical protein
MLSFVERLEQARAEAAQREDDPLREKVETLVRGMEAISTAALLDLIALPPTTGNARRISRTMQSLGFVPMKSRRFMPGGWRSTVSRGWASPVRTMPDRVGFEKGGKVGPLSPCHISDDINGINRGGRGNDLSSGAH